MKKNIIFHDKVGKALTPQKKIDQHNLPFTLNTSIGCHFACSYCFLQKPMFRHSAFGKEVKVKTWIPEKLNKELTTYNWLPQHLKRVQINSATEGYLPDAMIKTKKELGRDIMKEVLEVFESHWNAGNRWMVQLLTKSHMIVKHIDLLANMRHQIQVELTITTLDEQRKKMLEGFAPSVKKRLKVLERLAQAGIFVRVMCMPLIGTEADGEAVRDVALACGARAFKHKGLNYWDEEGVISGDVKIVKGQQNLVYEDLLLRSGEPVLENGVPKMVEVMMPVSPGNRRTLVPKEMAVSNWGYGELNDVDWGYLI